MLTKPIRDSFVSVPFSDRAPARAADVADALRMGVDRWHVTGLVFDLGDAILYRSGAPEPARSLREQWCSQVLVAVDAGSREEAREKGIAAIRARYGARINVADLAVALAPEVTIDAGRGVTR